MSTTTTYSALDIHATNVDGYNASLFVCERSATRYPGSSTKLSSLADFGETDSPWLNVANVTDHQITLEKENDETDFWDAMAKKRENKLNTTIKRRSYDLTLTNFTPFIHAVMMGVKNPFAAAYGAEQKVDCFASNKAEYDSCFMLKEYNKDGDLVHTVWFYGKIIVGDSAKFDNKVVKVPMKIEIEPLGAEYVNTKEFTHQTAS